MVRGSMVGGTDYSHQSLSDMIKDLHSWITALTETINLIDTTENELVQVGFWNQCDYDFRSICGYSRKFFDTATSDLKEVIDGVYSEIKEFHVKVLFKLAETAREINKDARKIWSSYSNKDYGDPVFKKVESLHYELCSMTGDMYDLNNLAYRFNDFVGRKVNSMGDNAKVSNVFNAPVTGFQQNLDHSTGTQNIGAQTIDLDELKTIVLEIKELLRDVPIEDKEEIEESLIDLEEAIQNNDTKKSKLKAFGGAITNGLKSLFTMESFNKIDEVSAKLPQVAENFGKVLHKIIGI
jgi:hypothetical protein